MRGYRIACGCLAGLVGVAMTAGVAAAARTHVLGPGQERAVRKLVEAEVPLPGGCAVGAIRVAGEQVDVAIRCPDGAHVAHLRHPRRLELPATLPADVVKALNDRIVASDVTLRWQVIGADAPPRQRPGPVAVSWDPDGGVVTRLDPRVTAARDLLLAGNADAARQQLDPLVATPERAPPGAISVWLAAGGAPPGDIEALLDKAPEEPRLLALGARRARLEHRYARAAWYVRDALAHPLVDGLALDEAWELGWLLEAPPDALPSPPPEGPPQWPWYFGGAVLLGLLLLAAWRLGDRLGGALCLLGAGAAAATLAGLHTTATRPALPELLAAPLAGGPCEALATVRSRRGLVASAWCPTDSTWVRVGIEPGRSDAPAFVRTEHHRVLMDGHGEVAAAMARHVADNLRAAEAKGFRVAGVAAGDGTRVYAPTSEGTLWSARSELAVGAGVVLAGLLAALAALLMGLRGLLADPALGRHRVALGAALAVAVIAHGLMPERPIMVYSGYGLTENLGLGVVARYGVGATWLYGPLHWAFGTDHHWIMLLNRTIYGLGALLMAVVLARRWFPERPVAAVATAWFAAATPLFWRVHTSESILVGSALLMLGGLAWLTGQRRRLVAGALAIVAAGLTRPEMAVAAALIPVWLWLAEGRPRPKLRGAGRLARPVEPHVLTRPLGGTGWALWAVAVGGLVLLGVNIWQRAEIAELLKARGGLPNLIGWEAAVIGGIARGGLFGNPTWWPSVVSLLVLVAAFHRETRRFALPAFVLALIWIGASSIDTHGLNMRRVHVPIVLFGLPLAGVGAALLLDREAVQWRWLRAASTKARLLAIVVFFLAGNAWAGVNLFQRTNGDAEEQLWQDVAAQLPEGPGCFATVGDHDPPTDSMTPRFTPHYLIANARPAWSRGELADIERLSATCDGPVYALLGMRCYMRWRLDHGPPPEGTPQLEACADVRQRYRLEPLLERDVPNAGDIPYPMYPAGSPLKVGFYRVPATTGSN